MASLTVQKIGGGDGARVALAVIVNLEHWGLGGSSWHPAACQSYGRPGGTVDRQPINIPVTTGVCLQRPGPPSQCVTLTPDKSFIAISDHSGYACSSMDTFPETWTQTNSRAADSTAAGFFFVGPAIRAYIKKRPQRASLSLAWRATPVVVVASVRCGLFLGRYVLHTFAVHRVMPHVRGTSAHAVPGRGG